MKKVYPFFASPVKHSIFEYQLKHTDMKKGIYEINWSDKGNKPAVEFKIKQVSEEAFAGAHIPVKNGEVNYFNIEITEEEDGNKDLALKAVKNFLDANSIEVVNFSDKLHIS